jgi:hypothetical protein
MLRRGAGGYGDLGAKGIDMNGAVCARRIGGVAIGLLAQGVAAADAADRSDAGPRAGSPASRQASASQPGRGRAVARPEPAAAYRRPVVATATPAAAAPSGRARATTSRGSLFNNVSPKVSAVQTSQSGTGLVNGSIEVSDPDSTAVTVAVSHPPAHGTVTVQGDQFVYTANPALAHTGTTDTFGITADDAASGFHVHGLGGLVHLLTAGRVGQSGHLGVSTVTVAVAPFNNPPNATVRVGTPDPLTGVVTGAVIGIDPNGDTVTYRGPTTTGKGAVTVSATGEFVYTPTDEALAGAGAPGADPIDRQDGFSVTVDDSYGGITAVPVVVPVGTAAPVALSTFCGCTLMPADSVFHADVTGLAVLASSTTWTDLLGGRRGAMLRAAWGGQPWMGSTAGMPVNTVSATRPGEQVVFNRGVVTSGPSIDDRPYAIPDRPLVEGMPDVPAWDRHLLVLQEGTCRSQELYNVANGVELPAAGVADALGNALYARLYGSAWIAEAGVQYDVNSPLYPAKGQANASHLPYLPLILRPDDLIRGSIDHMLGIVIAKDRGTGYTWPARAGDGTGTDPNGIPMGTVFRLRADFDLSPYAPATQVVLRALQQHGAVVYDSWSPGTDGAGLLAMSNGWTGTDHVVAQRELSTIPISAFEAVDVLSLALDPGAGWMIRT